MTTESAHTEQLSTRTHESCHRYRAQLCLPAPDVSRGSNYRTLISAEPHNKSERKTTISHVKFTESSHNRRQLQPSPGSTAPDCKCSRKLYVNNTQRWLRSTRRLRYSKVLRRRRRWRSDRPRYRSPRCAVRPRLSDAAYSRRLTHPLQDNTSSTGSDQQLGRRYAGEPPSHPPSPCHPQTHSH